jgi:hypothetical protein
VVLIVCALADPELLERPSAYWWRFSDVISQVASSVLLSLIFVLAFVPISIAWRLLRKDPLQRRRGQWKGWSQYPARYRATSHYQRMF